MNELTQKDRKFEWTPACQQSFDTIKDRIAANPILAHFDLDLQTYIKADASDYVTGGVMSQIGKDRTLRPVAFFSHQMLPAKCNYKIYDKELLAIIKCFEE